MQVLAIVLAAVTGFVVNAGYRRITFSVKGLIVGVL